MEALPAEWVSCFDRRLDQAKVPHPCRPRYHKWVKFYLHFCQKFAYPPTAPTALGPFLTKLADHNFSVDDRHHAAIAVRLLLRYDPQDQNLYLQLSEPCPPPTPERIDSSLLPKTDTHQSAWPLCPAPKTASWEREYRDLETEIKLRNYSPKTFDIYRFWLTRFQAFVRSRPVTHLSNQEVRGFLSYLAVQRGVSASSQNQAFNALLFFFRHVLHRDFGQIDGVVRAKRHRYIPVVLSRTEVQAVLARLQPPYRLVVLLLYGCGLRLAECVNLRIHCFNLDAMLLTVHDGKGQKDRTVPLPARALPEIRAQMEKVRRLHTQDLAARYAGVFLPRHSKRNIKTPPGNSSGSGSSPRLSSLLSVNPGNSAAIISTNPTSRAPSERLFLVRASPNAFLHTLSGTPLPVISSSLTTTFRPFNASSDTPISKPL